MNLTTRLQAHLQRGSVGFPTTLASSIGVIMSSPVILTVVSGFGIGGSTFALAILIAFVMMQFQLTTFSEAAAILPTSGSVYDYIACGMGRFFAITGALAAYLIVHIFAGTAETILSGVMILVNFQHLTILQDSYQHSWLVGIILVVIFGLLNAIGIELFGKAEIILTFGMWMTLVIFGITGLLLPHAVATPGWFGARLDLTHWSNLFSLIGMAMFMFVGCELVTPMAPDIKNSAWVIPRAMMLGLTIVVFCMFLYGGALVHQVENVVIDPTNHVRLFDSPIAVAVLAGQVMGEFGRYWFGFGLLLAGAATINTLMAAVPRILYGMAVDGALPKFFAYLQPRFKTPVISIAIAVLIPCTHAVIINGDLTRIMPMVLAAVCAWGVAYLLVNISIVRLRIKQPDLLRAYHSPWFPLPQIISSIGIIIAIVYIAPPGIPSRAIYLPFGIIITITATYALVWTLLIQRINPFKTISVEQIQLKAINQSEQLEANFDQLISLNQTVISK